MEKVHLAVLALTVIGIVFADHEGFAYMRGKKQILDPKRVKVLHYAVGVGLLLMILTGASMALPGLSYYMSEPVFQLKMFFVAVLIVNSFFISRLMHVATEKPFAALTSRERLPLMVSGAASTIGWVGAAVIGLFFL